jgi:phosphoribosyl 1,2-cyclic phosphodiesterase
MKVIILGSSSEGNCYILQGERETLIIEAGVKFSEIKKALKFDLSSVVGCIITHEHRDHSKALVDFLRYGIKVLALPEVFDSHNVRFGAFCKHIAPNHGYRVGSFKIMALSAYHDVPCVSFVVEHPECGRLLFATDTMMLEYKVRGLNHIFVECNYTDECLQENIDRGLVPLEMRNRLLHTHMELQTTKSVLEANDLSQVYNIVLLHLSQNNGDGERCVREISSLTGKPVMVAKAGMEIELTRNPF